jgi:hypothetical protein
MSCPLTLAASALVFKLETLARDELRAARSERPFLERAREKLAPVS